MNDQFETLRKSEERYRAVVEDQTEVICRFLADGTFTFVNEVYCRFFGKSQAELIGQQWQPVAVADDLPHIQAQLQQLSPTHPVVVIENRVHSGQGDIRWMQFVNRGFFDQQGRLTEIQSVGRDITERKQMEDALRASESKFRTLAEGIAEVFWLIKPGTPEQVIYISPAYEAVWGRPSEELYRNPRLWIEAIHGEDRERVWASFAAFLQGMTGYDIEYRIVLPSGTVRWIWARGFDVVDERIRERRLVAGLAQNITERKQVEEELRIYRVHLEDLVAERTRELQQEIGERTRIEAEMKSQARFPAENPNPVLRMTQEGVVLYANRPGENLLRVWGCQIAQLLPEPWRVVTQQAFQTHTNQIMEAICGEHILLLNFVPIAGADYVNLYGLDITQRKQAEEALKNAKDELETTNRRLEERVQEELEKQRQQQQLLLQRSKLESLGKLAAGIAHEINQPLAGISMGLDNVLLKISSGKLTDAYLQQKIEVLLKHIERIKAIIDHIRTFSRDQVAAPLERVDVNDVCRNVAGMLQTQYRHHNVTVTLRFAETAGYIVGNAYKLEQVLLNLLSNAKDAVDEKEQASGERSYQKQITLTTIRQADNVVIEIHDNGAGIAAEHLPNIFDPFFTTKDPEHGTGLGLSVSYGIIQEMQGEITVQSQPGEYTVMRVSLPRLKG